MGAPGRSKSLRSRAGTRSGRSPTAKLGRLCRQVGHLGCHVGRLGREVGSPGHSKRRSKASSNACASSNGVRIDFSSFLLRSWKARTSIFVSQCSVSYTSHEVSTERARVTKSHGNRRFSTSKSSPGASKSSSGGPWRAKNRARTFEVPPNF